MYRCTCFAKEDVYKSSKRKKVLLVYLTQLSATSILLRLCIIGFGGNTKKL